MARRRSGSLMKRKSFLVAASATLLATPKIALALPATLTPRTAAGEIQSLRQQLQGLIPKIQAIPARNTGDLGRAVQALKQADYFFARSFELMLKLD